MTAIDLILAGLVLAAMAALGVVDARRMIVDPRLVLALLAAGLLWRLFASAETGSLWSGPAGAGIGIAVAAAPIAMAHWLGRPWPLFPGDAMLLGGLGFVLGPLGLGWSLLAGSLCSLLHRAWLQRRRGRSFRRGYCPLGPGMVAGAMAVFVFVNAGGALAADGNTIWHGASTPLPPSPKREVLHDIAVPALPPSRPDSTAAADGAALLAATELAPVRTPLPPSLAMRDVAVDEAAPIPFATVTERIATVAGVPVEVEERPSRVADGALALPDPPDTTLEFEGSLPGLLNLVAARTGYDWTWTGDAIVFYRYRDIEQRAPQRMAEAADRSVPLWIVDPAHHATLLDVLEDWGAKAGWSVVWKPSRHYAVGARATFRGGFLDSVDLLMAGPATRRSLVALAHKPNRHLVIEDAGAVR